MIEVKVAWDGKRLDTRARFDRPCDMDEALGAIYRQLKGTGVVTAPALLEGETFRFVAAPEESRDGAEPGSVLQAPMLPQKPLVPTHAACVTQALVAMGGAAIPAQIHAYLMDHPEIGYESKSIDPIHGIQQVMRERPNLFENRGEGVYGLVASGATKPADLSTVPAAPILPSAANKAATGPSSNPPAGRQVADYALRALERVGKGLTSDELGKTMKRDGWQTTSNNIPGLLATCLHSKKDTFVRKDQLWMLVKWPQSAK